MQCRLLNLSHRIAIPPKDYTIKTYFENSLKVSEVFNLKRYERKLRVSR